jgi:uncharacterized protein YyaL (SSP411 family)
MLLPDAYPARPSTRLNRKSCVRKYGWVPFFLGIGLLLQASHAQSVPSPEHKAIVWRSWNESVFTEAEREHKFVLLDLEAVWCHWCHVMDQKTYDDPKVIALINSRYIAVRVDQDSRPDLANRYEDYGWPATVVYNADGGEIVKRSGFLPPEQMASMLQAIIDDPTAGPSVTNQIVLRLKGNIFGSEAGIRVLKQQFVSDYDRKLGGWSTVHKYLDWDNVEYAMAESRNGDANATAMARQTLGGQMKLVDPVWGGVYQYSIEDWDHPHFEKLIQMQAENLRIYSEAYEQWKDPAYLQTAQRIHNYVRTFLTSADGVVYTSQDADVVPGQPAESYFRLSDQERRKIGVPRIDQHVYARENGWYIRALVAIYSVTGDSQYRNEAVRAADWILQNRSASGGGFRHGTDSSRLYLGDTLAMGQAFLALYMATSDPAWLSRAGQAADFMRKHFAFVQDGSPIGFVTSLDEGSAETLKPKPQFDENVALARFGNFLFHYSNDAADRTMAETALRYAAAPEVAHSRGAYVGGLLLAENELSSDPLHIVVIGRKTDPATSDLFAAALAYPCLYKQLERYDPDDSASSAVVASYPKSEKAAAFVCSHQSCSNPVFGKEQLLALLDHRQSNESKAKERRQ